MTDCVVLLHDSGTVTLEGKQAEAVLDCVLKRDIRIQKLVAALEVIEKMDADLNAQLVAKMALDDHRKVGLRTP